ncbi:hypothetical protein B4U80_01031 [Leptotrombidium deliense]|uniref:Uncharacterized protein n=1 Tax=Leptotrombidium deliense TaxID=299467 RepID=A0A443S3W9_9ACAR|nr:hypothetical protein B4U80_01031 [Leptotrombidium deliense]
MDGYGGPPLGGPLPSTILTFGKSDNSPTGTGTPVTPSTTAKDPYAVINPKVLAAGSSRPREPSTVIQNNGGWPIGFESAISGKYSLFTFLLRYVIKCIEHRFEPQHSVLIAILIRN